MKLAVTGSRGQLVRSLVEKAVAHPDFEIVPVGRPQVDLETPGSLAEAIAATAPDVVINAAAYTSVDQAEDEPDRAFRINADAAGEAAVAAREAGAPIIQMSTDYVFDGNGHEPYREDDAANPQTVYGRSKLAGEEQVRAANPNHIIVRTAWLYSPFGRNFVKTIIAAAETRGELTVVDDQFGSPTSAIALAAVLLDLVQNRERGFGQVFHLAGAGETSWCGLAEAVMAECRSRGIPAAEIRGIASEEWPTKARRPRYSVLDSGKIEREFGIRLPPWEESVAETVRRLA